MGFDEVVWPSVVCFYQGLQLMFSGENRPEVVERTNYKKGKKLKETHNSKEKVALSLYSDVRGMTPLIVL